MLKKIDSAFWIALDILQGVVIIAVGLLLFGVILASAAIITAPIISL